MRIGAVALGGLFLLGALVAPSRVIAALGVEGHPRCTLDGVAAGYTWWADEEHVAITDEPVLEWNGMIVDANQVDCSAVLACLRERPEMAGRAATMVGGDAADHIVGTNGPDLIVGGPGPDRLEGRRGRDTLCGGTGDDVIVGGGGADHLSGRWGRDELRGGPRDDRIDGGNGDDALFGGSDPDVLLGSAGRDGLYGGDGDDVLRGGPSRDVCFGEGGLDSFAHCSVAADDDVQYGAGPVHVIRAQVDPLLDESLAQFTAYVDWILSDPRSWLGDGSVTWRRVGPDDPADLSIILAAPETVDAICFPLRTGGYFSCRNGDKIGININRWNTATDWWPVSLHIYRTYVINHEVGHYLGHGHVSCPGDGELADVMQQQTKGLDGCVANGWVFPEGPP